MCTVVRSFMPVGQGAFYVEQFTSCNPRINLVFDCGSSTDEQILHDIELYINTKSQDILIGIKRKFNLLRQEQKDIATKFRNLGVGIMGVHDMLIKLGVKYSSKTVRNVLFINWLELIIYFFKFYF